MTIASIVTKGINPMFKKIQIEFMGEQSVTPDIAVVNTFLLPHNPRSSIKTIKINDLSNQAGSPISYIEDIQVIISLQEFRAVFDKLKLLPKGTFFKWVMPSGEDIEHGSI